MSVCYIAFGGLSFSSNSGSLSTSRLHLGPTAPPGIVASSTAGVVASSSVDNDPYVWRGGLKRAKPEPFSAADFANADPAWRDRCAAFAPPSQKEIFSQVLQDWFMYNNFFRGHGKGFFVDVGANDPQTLSNSLFFEKCLGWSGLCIEPNPSYHGMYATRSCKLIRNCVSDTEGVVKFEPNGISGHIITEGGGGIDVKCFPLQTILRDNNVHRVDWLSLDIEGAEHRVLKSFPFDEFDIQLWLMETFWIDPRMTDHFMWKAGYSKVANLFHDDLYERNPHHHQMLPAALHSHHLDGWTNFRRQNWGPKAVAGTGTVC